MEKQGLFILIFILLIPLSFASNNNISSNNTDPEPPQIDSCNINIYSDAIIISSRVENTSGSKSFLIKSGGVLAGSGSNVYFVESGGSIEKSGGGSKVYLKNRASFNAAGSGSHEIYYEEGANIIDAGASSTKTKCFTMTFNYLTIPEKDYTECVTTDECPKGFICSNRKCITTNLSCSDSDGGINYYVRGNVVHYINETRHPVEGYDQDYCQYTQDKKGVLSEMYCDEYNILRQTNYICPTGCKDGVCIRSEEIKEQIKCKFKNSEKEERCSADTSRGNTFCEGIEDCVVEVEGFDGETLGWRSSCDGYNNVKLTTVDGQNDEIQFNCSEKITIINNKTIENKTEILICKDSCPFNNKCYPWGYRKERKYCSDKGKFIEQLLGDEDCSNNFECKSNICATEKCISGNLIQKIFAWFKKLFSNK